MKKLLIAFICLFTANTYAEVLDDFWIQGGAGFTSYQYDFNSNHQDTVYPMISLGYEIHENADLVLGWIGTDGKYNATSQSSLSKNTQSIGIEHDLNEVTLWLMPKVKFFDKITITGGPGVGMVIDTVKLYSRQYKQTSTRSGIELNLSLRADLTYEIIDNVDIGVSWWQSYFEVDTNRRYSDYEVNQDRTYLLGTIKYSF